MAEKSLKQIAIFLILVLLPSFAFSQNLDSRLLDFINPDKPVPSDKFFKFMSNSTTAVIVGVPCAFGAYGLISKDGKTFRNSIGMAGSAALNGALTYAIKYTINRERPYKRYSFIHPRGLEGSPSFPSGHTSSSFATATTLTLMYPKWYVAVPSYAWASTVAYSRMHLGVHYPSDVLGGIIVGVGSAFLTFKFQKWVEKKYNFK
jgi:membrane-associated phospholipid phosphatase